MSRQTEPSAEGKGREFDLIIVGSTGFVGKLAVHYLLETYKTQQTSGAFRWAVSGRSTTKMKQLEQEVEGVGEIPCLIGDCDDDSFVNDLARRTKVVAAILTPYSLHGGKLVAACVENGTHYCDITGEMLWMKENIDKYHRKAQEKNVKVVHACGLGSVPADLSAFLMIKKLMADGVEPRQLKYIMGRVISSVGGGTVTSYATLVSTAKKQGKILHMLLPDLLCPEGSPVRVIHRLGIGYDSDVGRWCAPLWLAGLDAEVVSRSGVLPGYKKGVEWIESLGARGLVLGFFASIFFMLAAYAMVFLLYLGPTRWLLTKFRPPGTGPNAKVREKGYGEAFLVAKGVNKAGRMIMYQGQFYIPGGDPGYQETAKMLMESAMCLIRGEGGAITGGVLTPAAAFEDALMDRLHHHTGMVFTLDRV